MYTIRYSDEAKRAIGKHRNRSAQVVAKIVGYAADPGRYANNVTRLVGSPGVQRLRVGDFRVLFKIEGTLMTILDIGPRGGIYRP